MFVCERKISFVTILFYFENGIQTLVQDNRLEIEFCFFFLIEMSNNLWITVIVGADFPAN